MKQLSYLISKKGANESLATESAPLSNKPVNS